MAITFSIQGLQSVLSKISEIPAKAVKVVDLELKAFAQETVNDAKVLCPADLGYLRNSIQFETTPLNAFINVNAFYAAYVEFGTGTNVFVTDFAFTPEQKAYAAEFFVSGKGHMRAQPFLFPAYEKNRLLLIERLNGYK